jgi:DNA polymerase-3 subunit gamma/tau
LAKALNCMGDPDLGPQPDTGPTVEPCLKCAACKEIADGTDIDVREIDGASYNGVDEVRKLQDSLPYRPTRDRYKIIIVDEVHMLSGAAWNAFLKTLEEPPPHVKFIFATTEAHKVPITILSRVQRFDFKLIPTRVIADRLRYVLHQEKISADESSVLLLARQAAGSMRDGMSLLDQVIAFGGDELTGEDVARVLGVASRTALLSIAEALVNGKPEECINLVGQIADQGFDIQHVAKDLLGILRDLVVARICKNPGELVDLADEERDRVLDLAQAATENDLLRLHQGFSRGYDEISRGADPRAQLEMLLVRLALRPTLLPVDELLYRLGSLEKRLSGGTAGRPASSRKAPPSAPRSAPNPQVPNPQVPNPQVGRTSARARSPSPSPRLSGGEGQQGSVEGPEKGSEDPDGPAPEAPVKQPAPEAPIQHGSAPEVPEAELAGFPQYKEKTVLPLPELSPEDAELVDKMMAVCDQLREEHMELISYLEQTTPITCDGTTLAVALESGFLFESRLASKDAQTTLTEALSGLWGNSAKLKIERDSNKANPLLTVAAARKEKRRREREALIDEVRNHPRVQRAVELLGAKVREVHLPE